MKTYKQLIIAGITLLSSFTALSAHPLPHNHESVAAPLIHSLSDYRLWLAGIITGVVISAYFKFKKS